MDTEARLRDLYGAFNRRDIDAAVAGMTEDVDWPNAWEGGRVRGHAEVRAYWTRQWASIDPRVEPTGFSERPGGEVAVDVDQLVRDLDGAVVAAGRVTHVYTLRDGLVARMDIVSVT